MEREQSSPKKKKDEIVVFQIVRESACTECGEQLWRGDLLRMEAERPLCMSCADLSHLVYLARGDAALTRRANANSKLRAVVVRFSRSRQRYERQGILVEESALARAEEECLADEEARDRARARRAERAAEIDASYRTDFARHVLQLYPSCPEFEADEIAERACLKYSGRVGRTAAAKRFDPEAIELAVRAHVRHCHTPYDELLGTGWDRHEARAAVAARTEDVVDRWRRSIRTRAQRD